MENKDAVLKIIFGFIIFLFSLALAFFTASYFKNNGILSYWTTLTIFTGIYIMIGAIIYNIYAISLGFLFAGDVLLLNVLAENFGDLNVFFKIILVLIMILILYIIVLFIKDVEDRQLATKLPINETPTPPINNPN